MPLALSLKGVSMMYRSKKALSLMLICLINNAWGVCGRKTFIGIRSQAVNVVRDLVGWQDIIHRCDSEGDTLLSITAEYSRSFRNGHLAELLFGSENFIVSGSRVADRGKTDVLADYFGLPQDFVSCVCLRPVITNFVMDFGWFCKLDCLCENVYFWVHFPIVNTKWDLNLKEDVIDAGSLPYPAGYMGPQLINRSSNNVLENVLAPSLIEALRGDYVFGDLRTPLEFGKVFGRQRKTRIAEIQCALGWDFFCTPDSHCGISLRVAAATGSKPNGEYLFEPIVGNMDHWELGGGFSAHTVMWSDDQDRSISCYLEAVVTHLFASKQLRPYDFKNNGPGSRYILLECMNSPASNLLVGGAEPNSQYQSNLQSAVNVTTLESKISIGVQADIAFMLAYEEDGWLWDLGYNLWVRSKEKLICRQRLRDNAFAFKGDAQIYGFQPGMIETPLALSATQSKATIRGGQEGGNFAAGVEFANDNADNAQPAANGSSVALNNLTTADATELNLTLQQVNSSNAAILIQDSDIDPWSGLLDRAVSHKLFTYIGYVWQDAEDVEPFFGIGLSIEWAKTSGHNSAVAQWNVFAKGGFAF
jgi:hypothetical protein